MKKYFGTKTIEAMPMTLGEFKESGYVTYTKSHMLHDNESLGFHVKYFDGIHDWIPKDVFESVYKEDIGKLSDGYHTFNELYEFRKIYNTAFFNELAKQNKCNVIKSKKHHDGEECFGGGWFIVMAELPTGQISNHYELKDWDLFQCKEVETAPEWDGHTSQDVIKRIVEYLKLY